MRDLILAFILGLAIGATFGITKLPMPAPPTVAGVAGILGTTVGWLIIRRFKHG